MSPESTLIAFAAVLVFGVGAQWLSWKIRVPSILTLLIAGFVVGRAGLVNPDVLLGDLLVPVVSLSVALILYEGGLTLRFSELTRGAAAVRNLVTIGAGVTWLLAALAAKLTLPFGWELSLLFGAVLVVTGPTVIIPLLQFIRPTGAVGPVLKWEGIVIDPIGAMLAVLVFEGVTAGVTGAGGAMSILIVAVKTIAIGTIVGFLAGRALALALSRFLVPEQLENPLSLMIVTAAFAISNAMQHESGLFAATVMGLTLANQKRAEIRQIVDFKENLRVLLIAALFILLAARLSWEDVRSLLSPGVLAFLVILVVIVRPACVLLSTIGSALSVRERMFLMAMAPRGIVAASIAAVFGIRLEAQGFEHANLLTPFTFAVIIGTVALYGLSSRPIAKRLGLAEPNPQGVIIVGAHRWAREIAAALRDAGVRTLLVDNNRANSRAARGAQLPIHSANILDESLLEEIDLGGMGRLVALTANDLVNVMACQRFMRVLGRENVYQLVGQVDPAESKGNAGHPHGRRLFSPESSYREIERLLASGGEIRTMPFADDATLETMRPEEGPRATPLFLITSKKRVRVLTGNEELAAAPGDSLIMLVPRDLLARADEAAESEEAESEESGEPGAETM